MEEEKIVPDEVFDELHFKREVFEKEVALIFDKGQAIVRFPSFLTTELNLKKTDRVKVIVKDYDEPVRIICDIIRGE